MENRLYDSRDYVDGLETVHVVKDPVQVPLPPITEGVFVGP